MTLSHARPGVNRGIIIAIACVLTTATFARADVIISNFAQSNNGDIASGFQLGAAVLVANTIINVSSVQLNQAATGPTSGESIAIFSRNPDGTVGSDIFNDFTLSFSNGVETATPNTPLVFSGNTGYWIILSAGNSANWNFTFSQNYTAIPEVTMPADHTSYVVDNSGSRYFTLAEGPQIFQVNGTAVPEPSGLLLVSISALGGLFMARSRRKEA